MDKLKNPNYSLLDDMVQLITKFWAWIFFVSIGVMGKFGLYFQSGSKQPFWKLIGSTMVAVFAGYLASAWCIEHYPIQGEGYSKEGAIIVPLVTLMSDKLMLILVNINWGTIWELIVEKSIKNKEKK